ncbi:MAG: HAMP domain-containing histidine kinase [Chitinophagaceae bacterium]|nr:MAG: HAMP domain-containing histidine kinase [Chitinophagaceae bacterium]
MATTPDPSIRVGYVSRRHQKRDHFKKIIESLRQGDIPLNIRSYDLISSLKYYLTEKEVDQVLDQLPDDTFNFVISNPIADTYEDLSKESFFVNNHDIEKEVKWLSRFIKDYSPELNLFLSLEEEYEQSLFVGDYEKAAHIIGQIESSITVSAWSIQQKLILAEFSKGFKANKDVLTAMLDSNLPALTGFLASYTSIRIEKNISDQQYTKLVDDYVKLVNSAHLNSYIYFKIDFFRDFEINDFTQLLVYDGTLSIIDRYKILIQVAQYLFSKKKRPPKQAAIFYTTLKEISSFINDDHITSLLMIYDGEPKTWKNLDFITLVDSYTAEDYKTTLILGRNYIQRFPGSFKGILLYCKALSFLQVDHTLIGNANSILEKIITLVLSIFVRKENYSDIVYSDLYRFANYFGNHSLSLGIIEFIHDELPAVESYTKDIDIACLAMISGKDFNPAAYRFIPDNKKSTFLQKVQRSNPKLASSPTINLIRSLVTDYLRSDISIDSLNLRSLKYISISLRNNQRYSESLTVSDYILSSDRFKGLLENPYLYVEILEGKFNTLVQCQKWIDAANLACTAIIKYPNYLDKFLHSNLLEKLTDDLSPDLHSNISIPVYLNFSSVHIDSYYIYVAYDNYLFSKGCETPKDYFTQFDPGNRMDVAFLQNVCKHETLYSSPYFRDQDEMDLARIEICTFLSDALSDNTPYESEISELLRKVLVRQGIKQIDYSKIYVDIKGLTESITKELKENFTRNVEIASLPLDQLNKIMDSVGNVLVYYMDELEDAEQQPEAPDEKLLKNLKLTSYNRFLLFTQSFIKIRDMFLFDIDCGLDTYLSMRIRHGTLPGQIRSIFEVDKLVTAWNESTNEYLANEYWLKKFPELGESERKVLTELFSTLSLSLDTATEKLKSQTIQISTETKVSKGMFNYSYSEKELLGLFSEKFGTIRSFETFVNSVFETLWSRTESVLDEIRNYINQEFTDKINQVLEKFAQDLNTLSGFRDQYQSQELLTAVQNARTSIVVEIGRIGEWFRRSNKKYIEEFNFDVLLDASVSTLRRSFIDTTITIENNCPINIDGDYFPHFTDIFIYLLLNALKHSKLPSSKLKILIKLSIEGDLISINVKNNISADPDHISDIQKRIEKSLSILSDPAKAVQVINKEGGTGYPKINKALTSDLKRKKSKIYFGLILDTQEPEFHSSILFEYADLQKKHE